MKLLGGLEALSWGGLLFLTSEELFQLSSLALVGEVREHPLEELDDPPPHFVAERQVNL